MSAPAKCRRIGDATLLQGPDIAPETPDFAGACPGPGPVPDSDPGSGAWGRASEAERDQARARLATVRRAEELVAIGFSRLEADRAAASEAGVSAASVGAWRRKVRDLPEGARVPALLDAPRSGRPSRIDGELRGTLEALAFHNGRHLTAEHAHRTLIARHGSAPSVSTVRRWLRDWRAEHDRALSAVLNPDRHRSHRKPAAGDAAAGIERLNQLWELDSTPADVICADPGSGSPDRCPGQAGAGAKRHAVVAAIDVWSRRVRVLVVPTSRATAIAALLRRCILEWGVPETVRTDEGRDYTSRHVVGALADLEIAHDLCPPYTPDAKPFVERAIGTLSRDLFAFLPGFSGHDVAGAQALRARKSFAARRGESAAKSFSVALTAAELQERCDAWCESVYGRRPHDGLAGASPFARAASWAGPVKWIHDERALDALLAEPAGDGKRTVVKGRIKVDGGVYIAAELGSLGGALVSVRRDPADLGRIFVYHRAGRKRGRFICIAEDPVRTGIDRAEIAARAKASANQVDKAARQWARELQRKHKPETAMDDVLTHARREAERVVALPRKGEAHDPAALIEAGRAADAAKAADAPPAPPPSGRKKVVAAVRRLYLEEV